MAANMTKPGLEECSQLQCGLPSVAQQSSSYLSLRVQWSGDVSELEYPLWGFPPWAVGRGLGTVQASQRSSMADDWLYQHTQRELTGTQCFYDLASIRC